MISVIVSGRVWITRSSSPRFSPSRKRRAGAVARPAAMQLNKERKRGRKMKLIAQSKIVECTRYTCNYDRSDGSGFVFECDADGRVAPPKNAAAAENLRKCQDGTYTDVVYQGVRKDTWAYRQPAIGLCDCGREIPLDRFTNSCDCGRDYNSAGRRIL
jgi:hypothetical protein